MVPLLAFSVALKVLKAVLVLLVLVVFALVGFLLWAAGGAEPEDDSAWRELAVETPPEGQGAASAAVPGQVTVLSWNIAYGRGPKDDAGDLRDRATVERTLEGIADAIRRSGADVVLLQEVDFDAKRTHGIDEARFLADRTGLGYVARVTTWRNRYVPYPYWPPSQHYGPMHSGQAVLARLPIVRNGRERYPQPAANPWYYNAFYIHRATQLVEVTVGDQLLRLLNTHLEAFDQAAREASARTLVQLVGSAHAPLLVLAGDFNALAPEATKKTGFVDEEMDFTTDTTIATIRQAGLTPLFPAATYASVEAATFTFPAEAPSRQLDHLFYGDGLVLVEGGVWREAGVLSDHLPIRAVFRHSVTRQ